HVVTISRDILRALYISHITGNVAIKVYIIPNSIPRVRKEPVNIPLTRLQNHASAKLIIKGCIQYIIILLDCISNAGSKYCTASPGKNHIVIYNPSTLKTNNA